jgi:uncharacterized DUF497 family protein
LSGVTITLKDSPAGACFFIRDEPFAVAKAIIAKRSFQHSQRLLSWCYCKFRLFVVTEMAIIFDPVKRDRALAERGLDFARCADIFAGEHVTAEDDRNDYGEQRYITVGWLEQRMIVVVWTQRSGDRRIISMRKANDREQKVYGRRFIRH